MKHKNTDDSKRISCNDCKHSSKRLCLHPTSKNIINGEPFSKRSYRTHFVIKGVINYVKKCGHEAIYFEQK